jgi:PAS domain S-box-containing protein
MSQEPPGERPADNNTNRKSGIGIQNAELAQFWLTAIIESAEDAIISKTLDGIVTSWNRGAERLFGYTTDEIVGKPVAILIPLDHRDEEPAILARLRKGERIEHYETVRVRKDGSLVEISLTVSPIIGPDGRVIGASKIARDISERKVAEERLKEALQEAREARERAEDASRLKDEFLATVSHELRTPLTSMLGWVQMLRGGKLSSTAARKALDTIYRNVKSQAQLVEDLLDVSRIVSGKMLLEVSPLDPTLMVSAAVDTIRPAAEAKDVALQIFIDPGIGPVIGDYERLQQVVWNLLSNAVKFTPRNGQVQVYLEHIDSNVQVKVCDNGMGIRPEFLPRAFDRFTQADSSVTRTFSGLGMGLAIVKSIVELHGGTVQAFSEGKGKGSTFTVSLPIAGGQQNMHDTDLIENQSLIDLAIECSSELADLRILVVDDQLNTCEMVAATLEQAGAIVRIATCGAHALAQLDEWLPDLIVADICMPEMDGYEFIRHVRKRGPQDGGKIPAVALTAMARIEDRVKALASGYQMHVAKPIEPAELCTIITSLASFVLKEDS